MRIWNVATALLLTVVTDLYFFPFEFTFLPGVNTKMMLAALGLVLFGLHKARGGTASLDRDMLMLTLLALLVSLAGFLSLTVNGTSDFTYATYVMSMWVWLGGAYFVVSMMRTVHGRVTVPMVCHYLVAVCVAQCLTAYAMQEYAPLKAFVDSFLGSTGFMGKVQDRMYGVGASLDVGGMRFAAVLSIIAYLCVQRAGRVSSRVMTVYAIAFCIIFSIGSMIGRTTLVGMCIALAFLLWTLLTRQDDCVRANLRLCGKTFTWVAGACALLLLYLYHTDAGMHANIRFGFEGFFSLAETGRWETHSNEMLKNMYVFPDNLHTWLVGDGYLDNPYEKDPYYIGPKQGGFYMGTDVGYLRFLFYFGLTGTCLFVYYMFRSARILMNRWPKYASLFFLVLLVNYVVWFKVASDLFLVFALFLCVDAQEVPNEEVQSVAPRQCNGAPLT